MNSIRRTAEVASVAIARARWLAGGGRGNQLQADGAIVTGSFTVTGSGNTLVVGPGAVLRGVHVTIRGSGNTITVGSGVRMLGTHLWAEGDGCELTVGVGSTFEPGVKLAVVENGRRLVVGEGCMFSEDVQLRTSDSHQILGPDGVRVNPAADVVLAERVWVGHGALLLKGSRVAADSVVAARAVVTREFDKPGQVLGGTPARALRSDITWAR